MTEKEIKMVEKNKELFIELSKELGGFGRYQIFVFLLGCITEMFGGMALLNFVLVSKTLPHR